MEGAATTEGDRHPWSEQAPEVMDLDEWSRDIWQRICGDTTEQAIRPKDPGQLILMAKRMEAARQTAANANTAKMDESYMAKWRTFCSEMGTDPLRDTDFDGRRIPRWVRAREESLQHDFVIWYYEQMGKGKGRLAPLPQSAVSALYGVRRWHEAKGIAMVPAKGVAVLMKAYLRMYIRKHGRLDLLPKRKEPLTQQLIEAILGLEDGTAINNKQSINWRDFFWIQMRALIALLASTGQRKSEALLPDDSEWSMESSARSQIVWNISGQWIKSPFEDQLKNLRVGDFLIWIPGSSKADYAGQKWAPSPVPMKWHQTALINAPRELAALELAFMVSGPDRDATPLFTTEPKASRPMRFKHVEGLLRPMLVATRLVTKQEALSYSFHSFRIFLATALKAMNVPDWQIQNALRWARPAMVNVYARKNKMVQADLLEQALTRSPIFNVTETENLPVIDDYQLALSLEGMMAGIGRLEM